MKTLAKWRLETDGTGAGTKLVDLETGKAVPHITRIDLTMSVGDNATILRVIKLATDDGGNYVLDERNEPLTEELVGRVAIRYRERAICQPEMGTVADLMK